MLYIFYDNFYDNCFLYSCLSLDNINFKIDMDYNSYLYAFYVNNVIIVRTHSEHNLFFQWLIQTSTPMNFILLCFHLSLFLKVVYMYVDRKDVTVNI